MAYKAEYVLATVSDLHVGSTVGLCPPDGLELEDGGVYRPSPAQTWLWGAWTEFWRLAGTWARGRDVRCVAVILGEPIDGCHHQSTQLATNNEDAMLAGAEVALKPLVQFADTVALVKGTPAHSRGGGQAETAIGRRLGAKVYYHLELDLGGVRFDLAHHIGGDSAPWLKGSAIRREVTKHLFEAQAARERPADVLLRGHVHVPSDTGGNFATWGAVLPGWQLASEFVHKVARPRAATVGGALFRVRSGHLVEREVFTRTLSQIEKRKA